MDRRRFLTNTSLTLTGLAAARAFSVTPAAAAEPITSAAPVREPGTASRPSVARLRVREAGTYQISGTVRLDAPVVEISGITNSQQITWSGGGEGLASFTSFERYASTGLTPEIQVRGGRLESVSMTLVEYQ